MLNLRDYQEAALEKLREKFREGHKAVLLYGPTGSGKGEQAVSLMLNSSEKGKRSAIVMDRRVLCDQTSKRLDKYNIDHGVLMSGHWRYRPDRRIQVCTAQTIEKRGSLMELELLIVDEAHDQRKQIIDYIKHTNIKAVGLSASPFTAKLGNTYTAVVSATTTKKLVDDGWLAPLRVYIAKQIDMDGAKKVAGEWSDADASERGIKITGDVVAEWVSKTHEIFGRPVKTIVFCSGVAHGQDLAQKFAAAGYNFVSLSYKDDDETKTEAIAEFSKPDSFIHGLIATDILSKGFDVPDTLIGISARPFSKSFSSHVQQMGRVMRSSPGKEFGVWLDFSGNYLRFREKWDDLYENGVNELREGAEKQMKEPTEQEKKDAKCPKCGHLWPKNTDTCPACGFVLVRRNSVVALPGEMVELDPSAAKKDKFSSEYKERFYQELLGYAKFKNYSDGWAYHKYIEKFGVKPSWKKQAASTSYTTMQWIKSRQIAYAKSAGGR